MSIRIPNEAPWLVVALCAALATALALNDPVDSIVWTSTAVAIAAVAGREADRRSLVPLALGGALLCEHDLAGVLLSIGTVGAAVTTTLLRARPRADIRHVLGAITAGLGAIALSHQPSRIDIGVPTLLAVALAAPALWSAYVRLPSRLRRRVRHAALTGLVAVTASIGIAALQALSARENLVFAEQATSAGIAAAREGDIDRSKAQFAVARHAFARSHDKLDGPVTGLGRLVPGVGDNLDAAATASGIGIDLTDVASELLSNADYRSIRMEDGAVDLDELSAMLPVLDAAHADLRVVAEKANGIDSGWLLPVAELRLGEVTDKIDEAEAELVRGRSVLEVLPSMLGGDQKRVWLVLFEQPAEARFGGGIVANYAVIEADNGRLDLTADGEVADLGTLDLPPLATEDWYRRKYQRYSPGTHLQNLTVSPDEPTNAELTRRAVERTDLPPIDGVLTIDPTGLAGLLDLVGPVRIADVPQPITSDNVEEFLLLGQYELFDEREGRKELLSEIGRAAFDRLTSGTGPTPTKIIDTLGPAIESGHLAVNSFDDAAQEVLTDFSLTGAFPTPSEGEWISVRFADADASKLSPYLRMSLRYESRLDANGDVAAEAVLTVRNTAPLGLPPYVRTSTAGLPEGAQLVELSISTSLEVIDSQHDGTASDFLRQDEPWSPSYSAQLLIPRGEALTLRLDLRGDGAAAVTIIPQPAPAGLAVDLRADGPDGGAHERATLDAPTRFPAPRRP